jgi:hypothetical protein
LAGITKEAINGIKKLMELVAGTLFGKRASDRKAYPPG